MFKNLSKIWSKFSVSSCDLLLFTKHRNARDARPTEPCLYHTIKHIHVTCSPPIGIAKLSGVINYEYNIMQGTVPDPHIVKPGSYFLRMQSECLWRNNRYMLHFPLWSREIRFARSNHRKYEPGLNWYVWCGITALWTVNVIIRLRMCNLHEINLYFHVFEASNDCL